MADSSTLRSRRSRAHASGDCSLCRHGPVQRLTVLPAAGDGAVDPRGSLEGLARRLEAASEADPANMAIAQQLRLTLQALGGDDPDAGFDVG